MNNLNITSAQYQNSYDADGTVVNSQSYINAVIDGVTYKVPIDTANRHYQAILDWVAEGNTIQDAS